MSDQGKPSFFKRWKRMHHKRKVYTGEYHEHSTDLSRLAETADYKHVEAFYEANPARRDNDLTVGKIDDAGLRWSISWLSRTSEVIARAANWLDDTSTEPVPEYVFIVGSASTEQAARSALARSYTLDTLGDALYRAHS